MLRKVDHIGVAVNSVENAAKFYREILGLPEQFRENVPQHKIKVVVFKVGEVNIELMEPTAIDSSIRTFLDKRGEGIHHICYQVEDLQEILSYLESRNVKLIESVPRIGVGGGRISFIHPKSAGGVLVELREVGTES